MVYIYGIELNILLLDAKKSYNYLINKLSF